MADIPSHHIIYGTLTDFITGEEIVDTDDERIRQELGRFLVHSLGYDKTDLEPRHTIETLFAGQFVISTIDFIVSVSGKRFMILRYGPGSLVTRERPALAAARVLDSSVQLPITVVTNGQDAEILDTYTGKVLLQGLDSIPSKAAAASLIKTLQFLPLTDSGKKERELRVLNAFDVEVCCAGGPCALPGAKEG
ncbi:MAG: type I restriction enzyme HsdR N-terminal domain-containing protein [Proteobacteria bacterium]|nr:type I restriction enzyme HsdR N-terminal domain-containing protein [Pseudomonadota bacterium]MBU1708546.1 type I restriction enzyme HsdR N-terminal domain-containing protein [Pseudomonadota bacterium]